MEITKLKERYERKLKRIEQDIIEYESSSNHELRIASRTLKAEAEELRIIVDALTKQIPMQAYYEYDDEFICPACSYEDDGYDVKTLTVCPKCGQKLLWE
jgi:rubrerythrin